MKLTDIIRQIVAENENGITKENIKEEIEISGLYSQKKMKNEDKFKKNLYKTIWTLVNKELGLIRKGNLYFIDENYVKYNSNGSYNRNETITEDKNNWSELDKYRHNEFTNLVTEFNKIFTCVSFELDHAISLKEGGEHHPNNCHILPKRLNRTKNSKSFTRMTFEEQIETLNIFADAEAKLPSSLNLNFSKKYYDLLINRLKLIY